MSFKKELTIKILGMTALACIFILASFKLFELKSNQNSLVQLSDPVEKQASKQNIPLKMYVIGEMPEDFPMIIKEVNLQLNTLIGVELTVEFIGEKDLGVDYHTVFAGGADFDLIQTYPLYYNMFAGKYAYMNLTEDMLRKCSPQVNMSELDALKINNMAFAIPSKAHLENSVVMLIRGDLAKTYGVGKLKTLEQLETYMRLIKNNEENILPLDIGLNGVNLMQMISTQPNNIRLYDNYWIGIAQDRKQNQVLWIPETGYFKEYLEKVEEWKRFQFIPEEGSSKRIVKSESFLEGRSAIAIGTIFEIENLKRLVEYKHPEYEPQIITIADRSLENYYEPIHHGIAIKNGSQYAAKSLMLIEILRTNEKIFKLLNYGIEGIHYCVTQEGYYQPLAESIHYPIYNNPIWCMTDQYRLKYDFGDSPIVPFDEITEPKIKMLASGMDVEHLDLTKLDGVQRNFGYPLTLGDYGQGNQPLKAYIDQMEEEGFRIYYKQVKETIESQNE